MRSLLIHASSQSKRLALRLRNSRILNERKCAAYFHSQHALKHDENNGQKRNSPSERLRLVGKGDGKERQSVSEYQVDFASDPELRRDPLAWNKLYRFAKGQNQKNALRDVWKPLTAFPIHEVPALYDLDIWKDLSGGQLIDYIRKLNDAGIPPPKGTLKKVGYEYHNLEFISATDEELVEAALLDFNVKLPDNAYSILIPKLCANGDMELALKWHRRLVSKGDPPRKSQDVEKLRQMLIERRQWAAALEVKKSVWPDDIEVSPTKTISEVDQQKALQSFVSKLDERVGIVPLVPSMEDHTCARFFATSFFSVEFVMEGMSFYGMTNFGSLTIREIIRRTVRGHHCDTSLARQYFGRMEKLGLSCNTRFGRLLQYLTNESKEVLLYSIVTSDVHPDLYDDLEFQETLLHSPDLTIVERTRAVLCFEMQEHEVEIRNILLRAGLENIELMIADGVPITFDSRDSLLNSVYINRKPWISETKVRALARVFLRLPYVTLPEWRRVLTCFLYIIRPHLRQDFEAILLSIKYPEIFDHRMLTDIIRWYLRLGSVERTPNIETMLSGIRVLAMLRDQGMAINIRGPCEANLMSLFGDKPISENVDLRKRATAQNLGTMEDFIMAIKDIWGTDLWPDMTPSEIKEEIFRMATDMAQSRIQESKGSRPPLSHTSIYNPGRVKYIRDQAKIDDESFKAGLAKVS